MSDLTLGKLSELTQSLSGKEAAKLVVNYSIKEDKEGDAKKYAAEVKTIVSAVSQYQAQEYNNYLKIYEVVNMLVLDLQTAVLDLEITATSLEYYGFVVFQLDIIAEGILRCIRFIPKIVTEEDFEQLYLKRKEEMLGEVTPLVKVTEYETFHRLQKEGVFSREDYPQETADWISSNTGKDKLSKELLVKWSVTLKEEAEKIERLIKEGVLKEGPVVSDFGWYHNGANHKGTRGITIRSWYGYKDKWDKSVNEHIDNKARLVSSHEGEIALALSDFAIYKSKERPDVCAGEYWRSSAIKFVEDIKPLSVKDNKLEFEHGGHQELIKLFARRFEDQYQHLLNYQALLVKIESEYFDGMHLVNREDSYLEPKTNERFKVKAEEHKHLVTRSVETYNPFKKIEGWKNTILEDQENYLISLPENAAEKWVEEKLKKVLEIAGVNL